MPPALDLDGFEPRIETFDGIHCAIDHDMSNLSMVEVEGGFVAIDTGSRPSVAAPIFAEWERLAGGPLKALIFTHSHGDHVGGAAALDLDDVPIWGQAKFLEEIEQTQLLPTAYFKRGSCQFGFALDERTVATCGIGRPLRNPPGVRPRLHVPNQTFDQSAEFELGGVKFELHAAPGETDDHLFVWLPERKVLFAGDNIYRAFPNLYSIRGVPPRPVRGWIDSLDRMRRLQPQPELLVLGHTEPIVGAESIQQCLTIYRDAIAFVHDSVLRGINEGKSPDQLAAEIRLPKHLEISPWLIERYGTVRSAVRGIYGGYMGWFDGQAINLDPVRDEEVAKWLIDELGGFKQAVEKAKQAIGAGDFRRAMWLVRMLRSLQPKSRATRELLTDVLEKHVSQSSNPLERNWALTEIGELTQGLRLEKPSFDGDSVEELPILHLLRLLPSRLNPRTTAGVEAAIAFEMEDTGIRHALLIRRGVGEIAPDWQGDAEMTIRATEKDFKRVFIGGDFMPRQPEFWKALKFEVPEQGWNGKFRRLMRIVRMGNYFIRA